MRALGLGDNVFDIYENQGLAFPGGNAVNVAVNAARLGHEAAYLGAIATDTKGERLCAVLAQEGVSTARCPRPEGTTTKCCIEDVVDGERSFKRNEFGEAWAGPLALTPELVAYVGGFDAVFCSCNAKMPGELPKLAGIPGVLVFDFGEKEKYRSASYLGLVLPAVDLAQFSMSGCTADEAADAVARMGLACPVLVTRGSRAPLCFTGGELVEGAASAGEAVDTMGAGDAFVTAFTAALVEGGWCKGAPLDRELAARALAVAGAYAHEVCQQPGGFGHGCSARDLGFPEV